MGVKGFWKQSLGKFREEGLINIASLPHKRIAIDTSAWMHKLDGIWEIQYARTSKPKYPYPLIITSFSSKIRALKAIGVHPIFVFDGRSPIAKKKTNKERQMKSNAAKQLYDSKLQQIKDGKLEITEELRKEIDKIRRETSRPIAEEYATLCQWFNDNGIEYVQAPFEADAQIKQIINEGRATAAITEDGDLVVFEVPFILSRANIISLEPKNSTCQYFQLDKLKAGGYESAIGIGQRAEFLPEISCLSGNDYINNLPNVGSATIFGTHKGRANQTAVIDSYIENATAKDGTRNEEQWLIDYKHQFSKSKPDNTNNDASEEWTPHRFTRARNLIKHYPVFEKNDATGEIILTPLNPLPKDVSYDDWGSYIGFDRHPSEYFDQSLEEYYTMKVVASNDLPRNQLLGPRYTKEDNPHVDTEKLLPVFARLDFDQDPIGLQPTRVLKHYLLAHGITVPEDTPPKKIREMAQTVYDTRFSRCVLDPEMVPKAVKWVGFEALDEVEIGDDYDDWVSISLLNIFIGIATT